MSGVTASSPLIIGATGGSGTRVVARIAQRAGYHLGHYVNDANDALAFRSFHDRWINPFLSARKRNAADPNRMGSDFERALRHHVGAAVPEQMRWGWKAPRSIYILPFLSRHFPDLKFIHVLRDGRDMAFSKNQNQLRKHAAHVLTWSERMFNPEPVRAILLWSLVNLQATDFAAEKLAGNYCVVRFEDLCREPIKTTADILAFLRVDLDPHAIATSEILAPSSIGRWRSHSARLISKMSRAGDAGLRRFGYI